MADILNLFQKEAKVKELINEIDKDEYTYFVNSLSENEFYLLTSLLYKKTNKFVFFVCANQYSANRAYESMQEVLGADNVNLYACEDMISTFLMTTSNEMRLERLNVINNIIKGEKKVIVTHVEALLKACVSKNKFQENILKIKKDDKINNEVLIKKLLKMGYKRFPTTTLPSEFSVRGEVIDIYPNFYSSPVRIDFFDDEVEKIKFFDKDTQKSIKEADVVEIFPFNEFNYDEEEIKNVYLKLEKEGLEKNEKDDFESFETYQNNERIGKYISYFEEEKNINNILSYIDDKIIIYEDKTRLKEVYDSLIAELSSYFESMNIKKWDKLFYYFDFSYITSFYKKKIFLSEMTKTLEGEKLSKIFSLNGYSVYNYQNNIKLLVNDILINKDKTYVICMRNKERERLINEVLNTNGIITNNISSFDDVKEKEVNIIISDNSLSFAFYDSKTICLTEKDIYKNVKFKKTKYFSAYQNSVQISSMGDIKPGDYVVHYDYGIGQYLGIKEVELGGLVNDYLMIKYENMNLYIPVEKINLLDKYQGTEGSIPHLNKIGTKDWEKKKAKIREKVSTIAQDLILVQAKRELSKGYLFPKDSEMQEMFESDFEFDETKDQLKAIDEIKKNMEDGIVVDRLVCGDVGYGKTEIAMRIAFKTIFEGMQVAYLAPTTILTRQHYQTFVNRFEKYGIKVKLLNRLVNEKEQEKVKDELKKGTIDVVIGTHSLLSEAIKFKNLGLLIIDEEQRFGVVHKEKIKKLKENVNVLTLTATPIPRTLQMSIMGVRQLSLIETPPKNRYPIQTYVLEYNDLVLKEAIYREINRGGQVFYLHNKIADLDRLYRKVSSLVKEAKITIIHGKMSKERVEDTIQSFIDGEFNVLICTTIIETGIDIPNTNTLIIDDADKLGLSQLYQIRGRVGRSDRVAYSYFMYEKNKVLTDVATKRLNAIKEFTTLGSGYKIAVRDLAIRGAGDILGKEQSGFIDTIGLDMYMKMLNEEIAKAKGVYKEDEEKEKPIINISKHVEKKYVSDDDIIIYIHKEINKIKSKDEKEKIIEEFTDRFGSLNETILLYIEKIYLDTLLDKYDIKSFNETKDIITVVFSKEESSNFNIPNIMEICFKTSPNVLLEYRGKELIMKILNKEGNKKWIYLLCEILEKISQKYKKEKQ